MRKVWLIIVSVSVASLILVAVVAAAGGWPGATTAENLGLPSETTKRWSHFDLALGPGEIVVPWAGIVDSDPAISWSVKGGGGVWMSQSFTDSETVWQPTSTYSGSRLLMAWKRGGYLPGISDIGPFAVMQQDVGLASSEVQTIAEGLHGYSVPHLKVAPTGIHLVFAGGDALDKWNNDDIYYAYRALTASSWMTPQILLTRTQVVADSKGGARFPRFALDSTGTIFHMVWMQKLVNINQNQAWYISGTWQSGVISLTGVPTQISILNQEALYPDVAVDQWGGVHVVWDEEGVHQLERPPHYINYRRWVDGVWSEPIRINQKAMRVNQFFPASINSAIAVKHRWVCIAWYGYYAESGFEQGTEDIWTRCSPDLGETWQMIVNVAETPKLYSIYPSVALDEYEQLHIAWSELTGTATLPYGVFYRVGSAQVLAVYLPLVMRGGQ